MEVHHVRYFLALCEEQNFTRAAEHCGIRQPTLTRAIKELEAELGGSLFVRSRKATRLSGLGAVVRSHFANIDRSIAAAKRLAADFLAAPVVLSERPKKRLMRQIIYGGGIAASVLLIAFAAVLLWKPTSSSRPSQIAGITDIHTLEATIDVRSLPRYDVATVADRD